MALELLEFVALAEFWFWFQFTGSCLVWVVTLGRTWLMDDHPRWALVVGLMLHVAALSAIICFWSGSTPADKARPDSAKVEDGTLNQGS